MEELKQLEELIRQDKSRLFGKELGTTEMIVLATTIGHLYGIVIGNPTTYKRLLSTIEDYKKKAVA